MTNQLCSSLFTQMVLCQFNLKEFLVTLKRYASNEKLARAINVIQSLFHDSFKSIIQIESLFSNSSVEVYIVHIIKEKLLTGAQVTNIAL